MTEHNIHCPRCKSEVPPVRVKTGYADMEVTKSGKVIYTPEVCYHCKNCNYYFFITDAIPS